jgi:hypothetical protein
MTNPVGVQLRNTQNQAPKPGPKHDRLHMAEGLRFCWCLCQRCFLRYADGNGICICRECPCAEAYEATKPMYVPYKHVEGHPR